MVWKRFRRRACSIRLVRRELITSRWTRKFKGQGGLSSARRSTDGNGVPSLPTQTLSFSARLRFAAQLFRACDESRLVAAPLPHQSAEELPSRLV